MGKRRGIDLMVMRPPCLSRTAGHDGCRSNHEKYDKTPKHGTEQALESSTSEQIDA
jgi:hypothetical protein